MTGVKMTRRLRYHVAVSLDGFIAGPNGEYDWIVQDPSIDFAAMFREFDTAIMGRRTYEIVLAQGGNGAMPGLDVVVLSRTLPPSDAAGVRIVNGDAIGAVRTLKSKPGGDIWLFGGGVLFRALLDAGLVDTVEVAVMPVLLGQGIPLLPPGSATKLVLADHKLLPATGIIVLSYAIPGGAGPGPRIRYVEPSKRRVGPKRSATSKRKPGRAGVRRKTPARRAGRK
jgi:dihydrofolate reductase